MTSPSYQFECKTSTGLVKMWREAESEGSNFEIVLYKISNNERFVYQTISIPEHQFQSMLDSILMEVELLRVIIDGRIHPEGRLVVHQEACERMRLDSISCEVIRDLRGNIILQMLKFIQ